jgi:hypothetical protein
MNLVSNLFQIGANRLARSHHALSRHGEHPEDHGIQAIGKEKDFYVIAQTQARRRPSHIGWGVAQEAS